MIPVNDIYEILAVGNLLGLECRRSILHTVSHERLPTESYYGCILSYCGRILVAAGNVVVIN